MAFVAAVPEVLGALGEAGGATAAAGGAAEGTAGGTAAGGGSGSMLGNIMKSKVMPIPHMGSNGPSNPAPQQPVNSVLNGDQFR